MFCDKGFYLKSLSQNIFSLDITHVESILIFILPGFFIFFK
jgi:hypothetical protein